MPYANNNGIHIEYEVEGDGPPLVLGHGFLGSIARWRAFGYVDALKKDYRLILINARGRGRSDRPHDVEAYRLRTMARDVIAVLDELKIDKALYFGYSMGGRIGFRIARYFPERFFGFVLGGASYPAPGKDGEDPILDEIEKNLHQGIEAYVSRLEAASPMAPQVREELLDSDVEALMAAIRASREEVGLEELFPDNTPPCLIFAGDADPRHLGAMDCLNRMPKVKFVSLPGLNHAGALRRIDQVLPPVTGFLKEISQANK